MELPGDIETRAMVLLQADIDDMTGEALAAAAEALRKDGARDVVLVPVIMKKGRPGTRLEVLCMPEDADRLAGRVLRETTTIGLRRVAVERHALARREESVEVRGLAVRVKLALWEGVVLRAKPEADDLLAAAEATGAPLATLRAEAARAIHARWGVEAP
jgi:uncharacterized protein (DUF111 family)